LYSLKYQNVSNEIKYNNFIFKIQYSFLDAGCSILDAGCCMLDAGCSILDAGCSSHEFREEKIKNILDIDFEKKLALLKIKD